MITAGNYPKWIREIQTKKQKQDEVVAQTAQNLQTVRLEAAPEPVGAIKEEVVRSRPRRKVIIEESEEDSEEEVIIRKKKKSKDKTKAKLRPKKQASSSDDDGQGEEDEVDESPKYKNLSKYLRK